LNTRGVQLNKEPSAKEKAEALEASREILNSESFQQLTKSTAKSQLKGIRRMFVQESIPSDGQGEICVVALGSPKTMAMADAIMTGNPSIAPTGYFGSPLSEQIPSHKTQKGLKALLTSYGVQMVRDEVGQFHLISFAQSGAKSKTNTSINIAKKISEERAAAALASFAGEYAMVTRKMENAESQKEFMDAMGQLEYESVSAYNEIMKSATPMINLSGGRSIKQWAAKHPISGQIVVGTVYAWSADSASASKTLKSTIESSATGANSSKNIYSNTGTGQSFEGSSSVGSSDADF